MPNVALIQRFHILLVMSVYMLETVQWIRMSLIQTQSPK